MTMGHQVVFYATPADVDRLEGELRAFGPLDILHSRSECATPRRVAHLNFEENRNRWLFLHLARPEDVECVVMKHVEAQGYWSVDVLRSPVIEFTCCHFDGSVLREGRAYYVDGNYEAQQWVARSSAFSQWARGVLRLLKRKMVRRHHSYFGPEALEWSSSDRVKLEPG